MSRTYKDKKGRKWDARMNNNGPPDFKKVERAKRRAEAKQALRENTEPDKTYIYSDWYW